MSRLRAILAASGLSIWQLSGTWAHDLHGNFELENVVELRGTITEYSWRNPHTFATLAVENDAGETEEWLLELNSISVLTGTGFTRETLEVGDEVSVVGNPDRDPNKKLFFSNYFVLPDGSRMVSAPNYLRGVPIARPPPRELDPDARSEDFNGIWRRRGGTGMGGGAPAVSLGGQTPARGLPLTSLGQAELDAWDVRENPWFKCEPRTLPSLTTNNGAQAIVRDGNDEITIRYETLEVERTIHLGMTDRPPDIERTHQGHSIGWFENDTLVVDTAHFASAVWGADGGRRLHVDYTFEDPVYLTEPVTMSADFFIDPGYPWQEYDCDPRAASRHLDLE